VVTEKKRVVIDLEANETIANQIAFQSFAAGHTLNEVADFLRRTDRAVTIDDLLRVILRDYEIIIKEN
jgi:hypothetical protein